MRTDEAIKADVIDQMLWDDRIDASKISISVDDGEVILEGTVPSNLARWAATDAAEVVEGVRFVQNRLDLAQPTPSDATLPADAEIQSDVVRTLGMTPALDGQRVVPTVDSGWVTLDGSVDAYWKMVYAEDKVFDVRGVIGVTNKLTVVTTHRPDDEAIARDIVEALDRNENVRVDDIDVTVVDGRVMLDGVVPDTLTRSTAHGVAVRTRGVTEVDDRLVVTFPG